MLIKSENNNFLKSITILSSGSLVAQLVTIISFPFITRLYSPEEIGLYTFIITFVQIFMAIINGRYDISIITESEERRVFKLIKLALVLSFFLSLIISFSYLSYVLLFEDKGIHGLGLSMAILLLLISFGLTNVLNAYNNRAKEYKLMTIVNLIRVTTQNVGPIFLAFLKIGMLGLLLPYIIGQYLALSRQAKSLKTHLKTIKAIPFKDLKEVMKLHSKQPLFSVPAIFANSFSYASLTFFITSLYGMGIVGYYAISVRLLGMPLSLISGNVSKIFIQEASTEYKNTGQFYTSFKKVLQLQFFIAVPMVILLMVFSPSVFRVVFGEGWERAGEYVTILAPMFGARFIVTAVSPGLVVANKQGYELFLQAGFILAAFVSFIITKQLDLSIERFLVLISTSFTTIYILYFIVVYRFSKEFSRNV